MLLHLTWTNWTTLDHNDILDHITCPPDTKTTIPLSVTLNRLLMWCIFLGSPVEEETSRIQDKSYDISSFCPSYC